MNENKSMLFNLNKQLIEEAKNGDLDKAKLLVSQGASVTAYCSCALGCAAEYGRLEVVKYLVSLGAYVTALDNYALKWATLNGHTEVVKFLKKEIEKRGEVKMKDFFTDVLKETIHYETYAEINKVYNKILDENKYITLRQMLLCHGRFWNGLIPELFPEDILKKLEEIYNRE